MILKEKTIRRGENNAIEEYVTDKHKDQRRSMRSIETKKRLSYHTHLKEVYERTIYLLEKIELPEEESKLLSEFPEIVHIVCWMHDLIEDVMIKDCRKCKDVMTCERGWEEFICMDILAELREKLTEYGVSNKIHDHILECITYLTKNHLLNKDKRSIDMYFRLKDAPLFVKIIKLADEFHNLRTLSGLPFDKALERFLKYAESWGIILSPKEYKQLSKKNIIVNPNIDENGKDYRTSILPNRNVFEKKLEEIESLLNEMKIKKRLLPKDYVYSEEKLLSMISLENKIHFEILNIKDEIIKLISENKGALLCRAGESQVIYAYEKENIDIIRRFIKDTINRLSFENLKDLVKRTIIIDSETNIGKSEIEVSTGGMRSSVEMSLYIKHKRKKIFKHDTKPV